MKKYILGMVTAICMIPIMESFTELIQMLLEVPKGMLSKKVIKINNEIQDLQAESEPVSTSCIGFEIPSESDDFYDDYDDKRRIILDFRECDTLLF